MQTANIMLALGGDTGNTVPKRGVTAAEIAVLRAIHGDESVFDIEPADDIDRSHKSELARLHLNYGKAVNGENVSHVAALFPGAASRVFDTLAELEIDESFYKPLSRAQLKPVVEKVDPLDHDGDGKKGGSKAKKAAKKAEVPVVETAPEPEPEVVDDEVEDMPAEDALFT
jgi:hypothetical protein